MKKISKMKKSHKIFHAFSKSVYMTLQPRYTINRPVHKKLLMLDKIQKLDLFGLQSYANINKVEMCHVFGPRP